MPDPGELGVFILDLDGTLVKHGTSDWLPGALELIAGLQERGYEVAFITRRGDREFKDHEFYGRIATLHMLADAGLTRLRIWWDMRSPRFLMDDSPAQVIEKATDVDVDYERLLELIDAADAERPA